MRTLPASASARSSRLGVRATPEQEILLRKAAHASRKSLTDFILDSACAAAEQTLLDQRLFLVSGSQYQALLELLERPEQDNPGLARLFARPSPWMER
jgi:uncharacterized protein (DUF1778 family)